ncbi:ABC transporter permease [Nocardioides sp. LHD-245]|uniref:ABC transporter permease n=1 Tax=Nocardioides sp. LHD-245 TaxID=3051387 RepID=UPI0027E16364|nr:ABC transporter permease [Nocardioides sp. LHD-245]
MSTTAVPTLDVSGTPRTPLSRLVGVEIRKALDTRAGFWFATSIVGLVLVVLLIYTLVAPDDSKNFEDLLGVSGGVLGYFLPILIIMLVTSEQSQRNGLVTFTLEPQRSRVVAAKFLAGVGLAASVMVLASLLALIFTAVAAATGASPEWSVDGNLLFNGFVLTNLVGIVVGFAIATLLMNTPAGIVAYFVYALILPMAAGILSELSSGFEKVAPWIEFNTAQMPLFSGDYQPSGEEWAQIATSGVIWLVIPLVLGTMRLLRIEFK